MNIKIQGGGSGTYANTGSCTGVTTYLQHEDLERMKNGREVQPFFNNSRDYISAQCTHISSSAGRTGVTPGS